MFIATKLPYLLVLITLICAYKRIRVQKKGPETKAVETKIVGGKPAKISNYPYMIRLEAKHLIFTILCGGTYIKPIWVITAAHCLDINDQYPHKPPRTGKKNRVKCIAGLEMKGQKKRYQRLHSVNLFINPAYFRNDTETNNDVGLIQLSEPFVSNDVVQMIGMPTEEIDYSGGNVTLMGWGASRETDRPEDGVVTYPKTLQVLTTTVHDMQDCVKEMESVSVICVGEQGKIACSGDSGSPLVYKEMLIGVCSFGFGCGADTIVYENIYYHMEWIRNVTEYRPRQNATDPGGGGGGGGGSSGSRATRDTVSKTLALLLFSILHLFLRLN